MPEKALRKTVRPREVLLVIRHRELTTLSDQTFRRLLRSLSHVIRRAQRKEFRDLLRYSGLKAASQQSLYDRCLVSADRYPAYYIQRLERGSIELHLLLGAPILYALLKVTLLKDVERAWQETRTSKAIRTFLTKTWSKKVVDRIEGHLVADGIGERFEVTRIDQRLSTNFYEIHVHLGTPPDVDLAEVSRQLDLKTALAELRKLTPNPRRQSGK